MNNGIKIIKELKSHLIERFGNNIQDVILFGSQIKGQATELSDFDVLIILKKSYTQSFIKEILFVVLAIELKYDIFVDTKFISTYEVANTLRGKLPIFKQTLKNGVYA